MIPSLAAARGREEDMHRLLSIIILGFLGLVTSAVVLVAPAAADDPMQESCQQADGKDRIAACTRPIDSRKFKGADLAWLYGLRGRAYENAEVDRAIADYTQALRIRPKDDVFEKLSVYTLRGQAFRAKGQLDRAIEDFTRSIGVEDAVH